MRSASAFFRPSRRPFGSKAVFGSAPARSWPRMASGIGGSLRLGMVGLLSTHHARPTHEISDDAPGGHHRLLALRDVGQRVPHPMNAGAVEKPGSGVFGWARSGVRRG